MKYKFKSSLVLLLKLVTGETVVAFILSENQNQLTVFSPFVVNEYYLNEEDDDEIDNFEIDDDNDNVKFVFSDLLVSSKSDITYINKNHIVTYGVPDKELYDSYIELVTSIVEQSQSSSSVSFDSNNSNFTKTKFDSYFNLDDMNPDIWMNN